MLGALLGPVNLLGKQVRGYLKQKKKEKEAAQGIAILISAGQISGGGGVDSKSGSRSIVLDTDLRQ